jgi:hypothetical protein
MHLSVKDLLIRIPLQRWPLLHSGRCPYAFCDAIVDAPDMEGHMAQSHPLILQRDLFISQVQLPLVGLMGIDIQVQKEIR